MRPEECDDGTEVVSKSNQVVILKFLGVLWICHNREVFPKVLHPAVFIAQEHRGQEVGLVQNKPTSNGHDAEVKSGEHSF